ncbi:MAG: site-specific integrase, partial [Calditrichaeota bacterium]|nr:site-specific integrase [Calditrichota bacterium]
ENPFDTLKPLRVAQAELPRFFELADIARIRERFQGDEMEHLVEFYLLTGVRLNEARSLRWDAVDLPRKFLTIRSAFAKAKKHRIISFAEDAALAAMINTIPHREDGYLFGPPDNQPRWSADWVCRRISAILSELGYPWASIHTFRHTYISHLIMTGVPVNTVKELIGHVSIATTLRYAHLAPKHKNVMAGKRPY